MSFIVCNKTPLKVAVQSLPSMNVDKTKLNSFIKQWQHQETVTNRLRAEGRGTRRAKKITQPPHNTKNTHYELGDHISFLIPPAPSELYAYPRQNKVSPKTKVQRL